MAKKQKKHHISRAAEKPDKLVEFGERALSFTRTHVVWIVLAVVAVVVGIVVISRLATSAREAEAARLVKLHRFEEELYTALGYGGLSASVEENIAKAESYIDRLRAFAQENIDDGELAPRILYTLALNSLLLAREYYNEGMTEQGIWACDELINRHSGSKIAGARDFLTRRNRIEVLRGQLQDFRDKLAGIKEIFDPEGLWQEPEEEPAGDGGNAVP